MAEAGLGARFRSWVSRNTPTRESFESNRWLRPVVHRILHPALWRFTRRSVPRGVALGMVTGILIPMGQIPASAMLALPLRANVPAAALTTFFTNPLTTPFLLVLYYKTGEWTFRLFGTTSARAATDAAREGWLQWLIADVGPATAMGALVCATVGGVVGYAISALSWRLWIAGKWARRRKARAEPAA